MTDQPNGGAPITVDGVVINYRRDYGLLRLTAASTR